MTHATVYRFQKHHLSSVLLWPGNSPAASPPFRVRLSLGADTFLQDSFFVFRQLQRPRCILRKAERERSNSHIHIVQHCGQIKARLLCTTTVWFFLWFYVPKAHHFLFPTSCTIPNPLTPSLFSNKQRRTACSLWVFFFLAHHKLKNKTWWIQGAASSSSYM